MDPNDAEHVYVGLEEIYETSDGGKNWTTIGPYWNFPFPCWSADPTRNTCPNTTHPDQHAAWVAADGTAYFGNDGGMYSRPSGLREVVQWNDLNATLRTLQYYFAGIGASPAGGDAIWGGMQDNGTSLLNPGAPQMVSPFGGDGGAVLVDPNNADRAVNEYVFMTMARTQNGGRSDGRPGRTPPSHRRAPRSSHRVQPEPVRSESEVHRPVPVGSAEPRPLGGRWPDGLGQPGKGLGHRLQQHDLRLEDRA